MLLMAPDEQIVTEEDAPPTLPVVVSPTASDTAVSEPAPGTLTAVPTVTPSTIPTEAPPYQPPQINL